MFFLPENMKKLPTKVAHNRPKLFFQYCQTAQNQPKSYILIHKNGSLRDFYIMTLPVTIAGSSAQDSISLPGSNSFQGRHIGITLDNLGPSLYSGTGASSLSNG
jgi:hypothetical protein